MVKKLKFRPEQLNVLVTLYNLLKKHADIEGEEHNIVVSLKTQYDIIRNQALLELGVKQSSDVKTNINIDLAKNEIIVEQTPVIVKANNQTMKEVANAQKVIDGLNGKKVN